MSEDLDFLEQLMTWLLEDPSPGPGSTSIEADLAGSTLPVANVNRGISVASSAVNPPLSDLHSINEPWEPDDLDLLDDALSVEFSGLSGLTSFSPHSGPRPFVLGEPITVQDRYHNLLKRRLQSEIQRHPPLFPWETELSDYEATEPASLSTEQAHPAPVWIAQLRQFELPVALPEKVLSQLLELCQSAARSTLLEGAKIVQAVESLFPGQGSTLNQLAQVVMMSPVRSGGGTQLPSAVQQHLPQSYETANSVQQMLLSLLAAREIVSSLTIQVSPEKPIVERQWQTERGPILLEVQYHSQETDRLRAQVWFPSGGSLKLFSQSAQSVAQRLTSGYGSTELFDLQLQSNCLLEIQLDGSEQTPLVFSIQLTRDQG